MALTGTKALQEWCKRVTAGYPGVKVENMTKSWKDGLAFCAIIHHYKPELIDFNSLSKKNVRENHTLAFEVAERELGIPALLDPEDMVTLPSPDKLSILTYLSQYYNYFKDKKPGASTPQTNPFAETLCTEEPEDTGVSARGKAFRQRSLKKVKDKENRVAESGPLPAKISLKSDKCEICGKRVYLVERQVVDGRLFHRNCFRCTKCKNTLRPDSYKLTKDPKKFECMCHSDGNIWNMRMNVSNRAGARLAGMDDGGSVWQSRSPKSAHHTPEKSPAKQFAPIEADVPAEPSAGNSKFHIPPVSVFAKPPAPNAIPMHPHLMMNAAARARFLASRTGDEVSPVGSPQLQRQQQNGGSVPSVAMDKDVELATSGKSVAETSNIPTTRPIPQPRNVVKSHPNGDARASSPTAKATENSSTESSSEDTREGETYRESGLFSTDDEVRSFQEGDTLSSIGKELGDSTGMESSDIDNTKDSSQQESEDDVSPSMQASPHRKPIPIAREIKPKSEDGMPSEAAAAVQAGSEHLNSDMETVSGTQGNNNTEESSLNAVNEALGTECPNDVQNIMPKDTTNKSVEEGSSGDSALWDTKAELSDSNVDEGTETKKSVDPSDASVAIMVENERNVHNETEKATEAENLKDVGAEVGSQESKVENDTQNNMSNTEKDQIREVIRINDDKKDVSNDQNHDALNPFGSEEELEEEEKIEQDLKTKKLSKRHSTNPFDTDEEEEEERYDESLNPFGDEEEDEGNESHISDGSVNPFTGSPIEETPFSLRLKNQDSRSPSHSFSHPQRPQRPPPPILSSGSYSVKTRSQILEELKRDRETLKKKRNAPPPPPGSSGGSVAAPQRARKSRKAPQPPQASPAKQSDGEAPGVAEKGADVAPIAAPRVGQTVQESGNANKPAPVSSPRMKRVQKPERPKFPPPPRTHSVGKRKAPAPPPIKREVGKDHIETSVIQKELIEIEGKQRELEQKGIEMEKKLRQDTNDDAVHDDELLTEWFEVVNKKNQLVRREGELVAIAQQQELELQHAEIEFELRVIIQKQEHERIDADAQREEQLLEMLVEVVAKRNQIVERLEEDRLREEAEDRDIHAMMHSGAEKKKDGQKEKKHKKKGKVGLR